MYGENKRRSILSHFSQDDKPKKSVLSNLGERLIKGFEAELKETSKNELQKAHIIEAFGYGDDALKIKKTGKEIKDQLQIVREEEVVEREECLGKLNILKNKIGVEPDEDFDEYIFKGTKSKHGYVPKRYSWELKHQIKEGNSKSEGEGKRISLANVPPGKTFTTLIDLSEAPTKDNSGVESEYGNQSLSCKLIIEYNEYARKYITCNTEVAIINTLSNVLNDSKEYELKLNQLTTLNF